MTLPSTTERWLPVVGYEGLYEVSDLGRARSLDRWVTQATRGGGTARHLYRGQFLRQHLRPDGYYLTVGLCRKGKHRTWCVHVLVARAFLGPAPAGAQVLHGPPGPLENGSAHLRYGTPKENSADELRDGTRRRGEEMAAAKLTETIVREARLRQLAGTSIRQLAEEYHVSESGMHQAVSGLTWGHV